jgi:opacity protein-like surface antigen
MAGATPPQLLPIRATVLFGTSGIPSLQVNKTLTSCGQLLWVTDVQLLTAATRIQFTADRWNVVGDFMAGTFLTSSHLGRSVASFAVAMVALTGVLSYSDTASAQNYPGDGRLRFGAFFQLQGAGADESLPVKSSGDMSGFGAGASFGYDWNLYKNWIVGVEADGVAVDGGGNVGSGTYNSDYFATFRGRVGYQYSPKLLLYGTGGVAFNGIHFRGPATPDPLTGGRLFKSSTTLPGFVAGLGAEYEWNGMHLFGEYLGTSFEEWSFAGGVDGRHAVQTDAHMFRLGVKFLYGHDHMYEDTRRPKPRY